MSKNHREFPYQQLGNKLKSLRQKRQQSLAEVSGAIEIEADSLNSIERGTARPAEDILLLLISYFGIQEEEAAKLWQEAGYDTKHMHPHLQGAEEQIVEQQTSMMVMPFDVRVVYTDMAHVVVNDYGVVMNFMQTAGPNNQPLAVARVGMSREHAKSVLELLQKTLDSTEQKSLPAGKKQPNTNLEQSDTKS